MASRAQDPGVPSTSGSASNASELTAQALDLDQASPNDPVPVLSYNPSRLRVQVTITREQCSRSTLPPADLIERAQARLRGAREAGDVAFFVLYRKRLERTWALLAAAAATDGSVPQSVTLVLAAGAPHLPGVAVEAAQSAEGLVSLTITATRAETQRWRLEWLALHVQRALRRRGIKAAVHPAQLHGALLRAQSGSPVLCLELKARKLVPAPTGQSFVIEANKVRHEISITVFDLAGIADLPAVEDRMRRIEEAASRLGPGRSGYTVLKGELLAAFEAAIAGPEQLGIGLPLTLLAAIDPLAGARATTGAHSTTDSRPASNAHTAVSSRSAPSRHSAPGAQAARQESKPHREGPRLELQITADRMAATVVRLTGVGNGQSAPVLSDDWLRAELQGAGVLYGTRPLDELLAELSAKLAEGADTAGLPVAAGTPPTPGAEPFLQILGREQSEQTDSAAANNLRVYQRHVLVKAGDRIAELRYAVPALDGRDVTGVTLPAPAGPPLTELALGEGIKEREPGQFFAQCSGIVVHDGHGGLSLTKALVHEGDANHTSGDIIFDGPVEIKGDVDTGVRIEVTGDLTVHGEIRGGSVVCGGNLHVERGIVVGPTGRLRAKGDIKADFVENSTVICGGSLTVNRSVMQSQVMVGGELIATGSGGLVGGGSFLCGGSLRTANLGLPEGSLTRVEIGVDFRRELTINRRQERLDALQHRADEERQTYREIMKRPLEKLSRAEKAAKERLRHRITRWGALLTAAESYLKQAVDRRVYDDQPRIYVSDKLSVNCQIRIGGKPITVPTEVLSVCVTAQELDGSYLRPMSTS